MKANEDKQLEKLVNHMMKDSILDTPSGDFIFKVMSQVLATQKSEITTYKPLISKSAFIAIFGSLAVLIAYVLLNGNSASNNSFLHLNANLLSNYNPVKALRFSNITTYTVVLTTIILFIQISLLKKYFDKQL
ncbi:hypothetical protein, partial [Flavobacterium sp.]|uniref:hypothetical protein n=1 Tax=Flavobacterium sp. TaxID=239 RepID=UPI0037507F38